MQLTHRSQGKNFQEPQNKDSRSKNGKFGCWNSQNLLKINRVKKNYDMKVTV